MILMLDGWLRPVTCVIIVVQVHENVHMNWHTFIGGVFWPCNRQVITIQDPLIYYSWLSGLCSHPNVAAHYQKREKLKRKQTSILMLMQ